ncbi:MAG: hypothetical protein ACR2PK_04270 [Acidimicrobiales bacterium]
MAWVTLTLVLLAIVAIGVVVIWALVRRLKDPDTWTWESGWDRHGPRPGSPPTKTPDWFDDDI